MCILYLWELLNKQSKIKLEELPLEATPKKGSLFFLKYFDGQIICIAVCSLRALHFACLLLFLNEIV